MAITLGTLYNETKQAFQLKLLAGENGLCRTPLWLYFSEGMENMEFLKGGELILITGFSSTGTDWLSDFVKAIHNANASGLIINVGKYISQDDISKDILDFCNEQQFPLLTMPWEMHLADITQEMCRRIFESSHQYDEISHILMALASGDKLRRRDAALLEAANYSLYGNYLASVFTLPYQNISERLLSLQIEEYIHKTNLCCTYYPFQGYHVLLFQDLETSDCMRHVQTLCTRTKTLFHQKQVSFGFGCQAKGIERLSETFQTAMEALQYAAKRHLTFVSFEELGIQQLFHYLPDKTILRNYLACLEPLMKYDREHEGELLKTLSLYLNQSRSIQKTAELLFCHRNTINYRVSLIKQLLENDLSDEQFIFHLQLAFQILDYLDELPV